MKPSCTHHHHSACVSFPARGIAYYSRESLCPHSNDYHQNSAVSLPPLPGAARLTINANAVTVLVNEMKLQRHTYDTGGKSDSHYGLFPLLHKISQHLGLRNHLIHNTYHGATAGTLLSCSRPLSDGWFGDLLIAEIRIITTQRVSLLPSFATATRPEMVIAMMKLPQLFEKGASAKRGK